MDSQERERIARYMDAGLCHVCEQPIKRGEDAVYSPTGAHYDCQWPDGQPDYREVLAGIVSAVDALIADSEGPRMPLRPARANGGGLVHWVWPKSGFALCGHSPKNTAWRMKTRGKWLYFRPDTDFSKRRFCLECNRLHEIILAGKASKRVRRTR